MVGIIYIPNSNVPDDLTGAFLDSDAGSGTTSTGLTNGIEYRAYALSIASDPFTCPGPNITSAGSIDIDNFQIGVTQTITPGIAIPSGGGVVTYEFRHVITVASVPAVRSTNAAYAHITMDGGRPAAAQWRAFEAGGSNDGSTSWQTVASGVVETIAPSPTVSRSPAFAGTEEVGQTLTLTSGASDGDTSVTQLLRGAEVLIANVTNGQTYDIVVADAGSALTLRYVTTFTAGGQTVEQDTTAVVPFVAPTPSITITGSYIAGDTVGDVTFNLTDDTTGAPPLDNGTVEVLVNGIVRTAGYNLTAGESLTARLNYTHVTGAGSVTSDPVTVQAAPSLSLDSLTYVDPGDTEGDRIVFSLTEQGAGAITAYIVTGSGAQPTLNDSLRDAVVAGAGVSGSIEYASQVIGALDVAVDITGLFTSASEAATWLVMVLDDRALRSDPLLTIVSDLDLTPGVMSGLVATPGNAQATLDFSISEAGRLWWLVDATDRDASYIEANGTLITVSSGAQTPLTETGLTNGVATKFQLVHRDNDNNLSIISRASVTPVAPVAANPLTYLDGGDDTTTADEIEKVISVDVSGQIGDDPVLIVVNAQVYSAPGVRLSSVVIDGNSAAIEVDPVTTQIDERVVGIAKLEGVDLPNGAVDVAVRVERGGGDVVIWGASVGVWTRGGNFTITPHNAGSPFNSTQFIEVFADVPAGADIIGTGGSRPTGRDPDISGLVRNDLFTQRGDNLLKVSFGSETDAAEATNRAFRVETWSGNQQRSVMVGIITDV